MNLLHVKRCTGPLMTLLALASFGSIGRAQDNSISVPAEVGDAASHIGQKQARTLDTGRQLMSVPSDFVNLPLAPGYSLQYDVYVVRDLVASQQLDVDGVGNVFVPNIGDIQVGGLPLMAARTRIAKVLVDNDIYKNPQVNLTVLRFVATSVTVMGEVQSPGRFQMLTPQDLTDVIGYAGGETTSSRGVVEIRHHEPDGKISRSLHQMDDGISWGNRNVIYAAHVDPTYVYPGDTIIVQRSGVVYVLGAVNRPGGYLMINKGKLSLTQAIALAGGSNVVAANKKVVVGIAQGNTVAPMVVDFRKMTRGETPQIQLGENDIVFVPTSGIKAILIESSTLIASAAGAAIYRVP